MSCVWVLVCPAWQKLLLFNIHVKKNWVSKCSCVEAVCKFFSIECVFLRYHQFLGHLHKRVPPWVSSLNLDYYRLYWSLLLFLLSHYFNMFIAPCSASLECCDLLPCAVSHLVKKEWFAVLHTASVLPQSSSAVSWCRVALTLAIHNGFPLLRGQELSPCVCGLGNSFTWNLVCDSFLELTVCPLNVILDLSMKSFRLPVDRFTSPPNHRCNFQLDEAFWNWLDSYDWLNYEPRL